MKLKVSRNNEQLLIQWNDNVRNIAMKKARDALMTQLMTLAQEKRQISADTQLQTKISGLETSLAYTQEELVYNYL